MTDQCPSCKQEVAPSGWSLRHERDIPADPGRLLLGCPHCFRWCDSTTLEPVPRDQPTGAAERRWTLWVDKRNGAIYVVCPRDDPVLVADYEEVVVVPESSLSSLERENERLRAALEFARDLNTGLERERARRALPRTVQQIRARARAALQQSGEAS